LAASLQIQMPQLESLEAQKTHYENYINSRNDWEFAGLYYDEGITGHQKG